MIADSVGLGKTYVGLGLIEQAVRRGSRVLLVVPAALKRMWRLELNRFHAEVSLVSHSAVGLGRVLGGPFALVVVDEAHAFRNGSTRRYRNLQRLCAGARVVLLTATPVNNSLADLYFQLRLFCADNAFRDLGIGSLKTLLRTGDPSPVEIDKIRRAVIIRRTRAEVKGSLRGFGFPEAVLTHPIEYEPPMAVGDLERRLDELTFPAHAALSGKVFHPDIIRLALLKRADSSGHALARSLRRQAGFYREFIAAVERGQVLKPRSFRELFVGDDQALQLVLPDLAFDGGWFFMEYDALAASRQELEVLESWLAETNCPDKKLDRLIGLLAGRRGRKTIVFTEYRDTARYLWLRLRDRFPTGLVDGEGAWLGSAKSSRREVIERFAPAANRVAVHEREACGVLIATDVLAEGMNLQDADGVVSYDLPWNPVRLIQRSGRVDRMGSPHRQVEVFNFIPDRDFDALLGLVRRLRGKLETVRSVVGLEHSILESEPFDNAFCSSDSDSFSLRARFARLPPCDGIPVAAIGSNRTFVGVSRGAEWSCFVERDGALLEAPGEVDAVLSKALSTDVGLRPDLERVGCVVMRVLSELRSRNDLAAVPSTRPQVILAREIRRRLAGLPLDGGPELYAVADEVLALLDSGNPGVDVAAQRILAADWPDTRTLLDFGAEVLKSVGGAAEMALEWGVTGVIVAD